MWGVLGSVKLAAHSKLPHKIFEFSTISDYQGANFSPIQRVFITLSLNGKVDQRQIVLLLGGEKKQGKSVHSVLSAFLFLNNEMGAVH